MEEKLGFRRSKVTRGNLAEVHYKETPKFEALDPETRDVLINCISINSAYSTQVRLIFNSFSMS